MTASPLTRDVNATIVGTPNVAVPSGVAASVALGTTVVDTIDVNGDTVTIALLGAQTVLMNFASAAFSGTVLSEGSIDGGSTYNTCLTWQIGATANVGGSQVPTNAGLTIANVVGMTHFRIRVSAYTSGSAVCTMRSAYSQGVVSSLNGAIGQVSTISGNITPGVSAGHLGKAEDAVHTSGDTGVFVLGVRSDSEVTLTSNNGDYGPLATDISGRLIVTPKPTGFASGSVHRVLSANSTNATNVKSASGNVYSLVASNMNAAARFLKLYNKASAPTVGTDTPVATILLPPTWTVEIPYPIPMPFSTGIGYAMTTGVADADVAAVAAADIALTLVYA